MADKQLTTDEEILSSIGEGDDDADDQVDQQEEGQDNEPPTKPGDQESKVAKGSDKKEPSAKESGKGVPGKQGGKQASGPQDLVGADGKVIARGGPERRFYEEAQRWKNEAGKFNRELTELRPQLQALKDANQVGKQYNLTPAEVVTGAQLLKAYKDDPKATIKYLLTQAQASGIDLNDVIQGGGVSTAAIREMITEMMSPILAERQEKQQYTQIQQQAQEEYSNFMSAYPDAAIHNEELAQLLEKFPSLSPEAAYWRLKAFYNQHGLGFDKTLTQHEQIIRAKGGKDTQRRSLPSGVNVSDVEDVDDTEDKISTSSSLDEIIRSSMREAGMKA